jgi:succinate dehydrogenase/fumarate reductase flavoprotein subunit
MDDLAQPDAVIVGSGAAGLVAALATASHGLRTVVLERTATIGGTSAMSGGLIYAPGSRLSPKAGDSGERVDVASYLAGVARRPLDDAMIDAFLSASPEMVDLLDQSGVALRLTGLVDYYGTVPGAGSGRVLATEPFDPDVLGELAPLVRRTPYRNTATGPWEQGMSVIGNLVAACVRAGVEIRTGFRVRDLLIEDGQVVGVTGESEGGPRIPVGRRRCSADPDEPVAVRAAAGVVLASGGYEFNHRLVQQYIRQPLEGAWSCPGNEGDSIVMAEAAGAQLAAMGEAQWYALLRLSDETLEGAPLFADASPARHLPGSLIVDAGGTRFANEATLFQDFGRALAGTDPQRVPAWMVMDQQFLDTYGARSFGGRTLRAPHWITADSVAALATAIGVDEGALVATVQRFNDGAAAGLDADFGRGSGPVDQAWGDSEREGSLACLAPLSSGPFHATRVYVGCSGTTGGPVIDPHAQVLDRYQHPIPGLFAAGNLTPNLFGDAAPASGATLGPGMTFGFLAGQSIVARASALTGSLTTS